MNQYDGSDNPDSKYASISFCFLGILKSVSFLVVSLVTILRPAKIHFLIMILNKL